MKSPKEQILEYLLMHSETSKSYMAWGLSLNYYQVGELLEELEKEGKVESFLKAGSNKIKHWRLKK